MKLPDGVVTFLFTDVEGSTRLWEDAPDAMMDALRLHDEKIEIAVDEHNGVSVKPRGEGDSRFVVFQGADDAVAAVAEIQLQLAGIEWPIPRPLPGLAELEMGDYYGSAVNRAARLRAIAHGGQTVLSGATFEVVQDRLPSGVTLSDMGRRGRPSPPLAQQLRRQCRCHPTRHGGWLIGQEPSTTPRRSRCLGGICPHR